LTPEERAQRLAGARALYDARDYPGVQRELGTVAAEELLAEPELAFLLADSLRRLGEGRRALELAAALAPVCAHRGNDRLNRDRLNLEGMLLFERGDVAEAEEAWEELLDAASRAADVNFVARSSHNLGAVHALRGDAQSALASYNRALVAYRRLGYLRGMAQAHYNLAMAYREMDRWKEADRHLRTALGYARRDGSDDEVAANHQERAMLLVLTGDTPHARALAARAIELFERLSDPGGVGNATLVLGMAALADGRADDAKRHLEEALELARRTATALLEAEAIEALAALADAEGRDDEAAQLRARAEAGFAALSAAGWGQQVRRRLRTLPGPRAS
jgi:tetratricopeptide (TPR) repeat protein